MLLIPFSMISLVQIRCCVCCSLLAVVVVVVVVVLTLTHTVATMQSVITGQAPVTVAEEYLRRKTNKSRR